MRRLTSRLADGGRRLRFRFAGGVRRLGRALSGAQGVVGVGCVTGGTYLEVGLGVALLVLGAFLLLGAWVTR